MTTPQLPPEIKSAEDHFADLLSDEDGKWKELIHQRDLAIWNAAIEKAAASWKYDERLSSIEQFAMFKQAVLTLKQYE